MKPLYTFRGEAREYGDYVVDIYTGCPHRCRYCFVPWLLHKDPEEFHSRVKPRPGIVKALRAQIEREGVKDKLIHLCFTCDPYPTGCDTTVTREVIKVIKESGNHVQILTKGDGSRDFDLLDGNDWYGITISGDTMAEPGALSALNRIVALPFKKEAIKTWVSFEPVLSAEGVLRCIGNWHKEFDKVKIGKLNYHSSTIDWADFGRRAEALCKKLGADYYIKDSLREEMEGQNEN